MTSDDGLVGKYQVLSPQARESQVFPHRILHMEAETTHVDIRTSTFL